MNHCCPIIHTHTHTHTYIYIYIYIERERERKKDFEKYRKGLTAQQSETEISLKF